MQASALTECHIENLCTSTVNSASRIEHELFIVDIANGFNRRHFSNKIAKILQIFLC